MTVHTTALKKIISIAIAAALLIQLSGCSLMGKVKKAGNTVVAAAENAKDTVVNVAENATAAVVRWFSNLDLSAFEDGWNAAVGFAGTAYATALSSSYVADISQAISVMKTSINESIGSARGVAQEAGFIAEKWVAGTFNIDAAVHESPYSAAAPGSNGLGSADVVTTYGEEVSLKYYSTAERSANAQAAISRQSFEIIRSYREYYNVEIANDNPTPMEFIEYIDFEGYDASSHDVLLESTYSGQTRIIPSDQILDATDFLKGRADVLSSTGNSLDEESAIRYRETLSRLKDRIEAPDGTQSKPLSRDEAQAIAELVTSGNEFKPEDFGLKLSQVLDPKYVMKQAVGTGLQTGVLKTVFTVGPDLVSIIAEGIKTGIIDENSLEETGIDGLIAMGQGFVEGSVSRIVVTMCQSGAWGDELMNASPDVVSTLVFLTIEAMISGYSLATGEITAEEYGCLIADRTMMTALAIPTTALLLAVLPSTQFFVLIGCLAGSLIASTGYTMVKDAVLELVDGGGYEAIVPAGVANSLDILKEKVASLNLSDELSNLKEFAVSTASTGLIKIKRIFT